MLIGLEGGPGSKKGRGDGRSSGVLEGAKLLLSSQGGSCCVSGLGKAGGCRHLNSICVGDVAVPSPRLSLSFVATNARHQQGVSNKAPSPFRGIAVCFGSRERSTNAYTVQ